MEGYEATVVAQFTPIRSNMRYLPAQPSATRRGHHDPVRLGRQRKKAEGPNSGHMTERGRNDGKEKEVVVRRYTTSDIRMR